MFLFPSIKKQLPQEPKPRNAFSLNCPKCGQILYSSKDRHECLSCGKRYSNEELLIAYSACAADCAHFKTTAKFHAMSMDSQNKISEFQRRQIRSLTQENQHLKAVLQGTYQAETQEPWEQLEEDPVYVYDRIKKLESRMSALESQLSHD